MSQADNLRASIKVCMFDQYGTVVDMQTGLTEAAAPFLAAKGWQGDPNSFVTWWRRTHFENSMIDALLHREHTSYREIGHHSVAFVLERAGIPYTLDQVRDLVAHIERLRPFDFCGGCQCLQVTCRNLHQSSGDRRGPYGRGAVHRQSRLRLHRR